MGLVANPGAPIYPKIPAFGYAVAHGISIQFDRQSRSLTQPQPRPFGKLFLAFQNPRNTESLKENTVLDFRAAISVLGGFFQSIPTMRDIRKYVGQISPALLATELEAVKASGAKPEECVLVVCEKRPAAKDERRTVASYFGHNHWRQSMWRIILAKDLPKSFAASPYFGSLPLPDFLDLASRNCAHAGVSA